MSGPPHAHAGLDGLVTGDAFGDAWFTRSDEPAEELWAAREPRPAPWLWTDDSAMAFVLFAHLTANGEVRPGDLASEFAAEYGRDPGRKYGPSMHGVLRRVAEGEDWRAVTTGQFGGQGSHGNGAAMRVAPSAPGSGTTRARPASRPGCPRSRPTPIRRRWRARWPWRSPPRWPPASRVRTFRRAPRSFGRWPAI